MKSRCYVLVFLLCVCVCAGVWFPFNVKKRVTIIIVRGKRVLLLANKCAMRSVNQRIFLSFVLYWFVCAGWDVFRTLWSLPFALFPPSGLGYEVHFRFGGVVAITHPRSRFGRCRGSDWSGHCFCCCSSDPPRRPGSSFFFFVCLLHVCVCVASSSLHMWIKLTWWHWSRPKTLKYRQWCRYIVRGVVSWSILVSLHRGKRWTEHRFLFLFWIVLFSFLSLFCFVPYEQQRNGEIFPFRDSRSFLLLNFCFRVVLTFGVRRKQNNVELVIQTRFIRSCTGIWNELVWINWLKQICSSW